MANRQATVQDCKNLGGVDSSKFPNNNQLITKADIHYLGVNTLETDKADNQTIAVNSLYLSSVITPVKNYMNYVVTVEGCVVQWLSIILTFNSGYPDNTVEVDAVPQATQKGKLYFNTNLLNKTITITASVSGHTMGVNPKLQVTGPRTYTAEGILNIVINPLTIDPPIEEV